MLVSAVSAETSFSTANAVDGATPKAVGGGGTSNSQNPSLNTGAGVGTGISDDSRKGVDQGTFTVVPVDGKCPAGYVLSDRACLKLGSNSGGSGASFSGGDGPKVAPSGGGQTNFIVVPDASGNCPKDAPYKPGKDENGKPVCLKATVNYDDAASTQKIVLGTGQITIEDSASTNKTVSDDASGFKVIISAGTSASGGGNLAGKPQISIEVGNSGQKVISESGQNGAPSTRVSTDTKLEISGDKIKIGDDKKELKVLPSTASQVASTRMTSYDQIELTTAGDNVWYSFTKVNPKKLFGFIPVSVVSQTRVSAEDSTQVKSSRSWWSFLAF